MLLLILENMKIHAKFMKWQVMLNDKKFRTYLWNP